MARQVEGHGFIRLHDVHAVQNTQHARTWSVRGQPDSTVNSASH
jgi:hypothetical protein